VFAWIGMAAFAQVNLSGVWDNLAILHEDWPDRLFGPELGDYTGVPLTDDARFRADAWDASLITLPEYQCIQDPSDYVQSFGGATCPGSRSNSAVMATV